MRARSRREHHYQIPVKDAIWASSVERANGPPLHLRSDEEPKVGDGSTRRRMDGQFWKAVKWVGKSEFLGYGRESGSRSPMRKEAEAKLIISFQSQQEKTAMLHLLRPTRKDRYLLTMKIKWAQSSNLPFKTDLKSYINFNQIGEGRLCKEWAEAELQNAKSPPSREWCACLTASRRCDFHAKCPFA